MRSVDGYTEQFSRTRRLEDCIPVDHPPRPICEIVNEALAHLDGLFASMYESSIKGRRSSIAPEKITRAILLQVLYSIRSERQSVE